MNNHDIQWCNNGGNNLNSNISFLKPLIDVFKFIYILKINQLMKVWIHIWLQFWYIPLNILIIYGKDQHFNGLTLNLTAPISFSSSDISLPVSFCLASSVN